MNNNHKPLRVSMLALLLTCVISILSFQSGLAQDEITSDDAQQQTSPTDILCGPTRFVGGNITEDTYWDPGYVYVLNSSVVVQPGVTLRVVANVVKAKPGTSITVNGKLIVLGTESSPRYFTSWKDDTLCGDTNGDGAASVPVTNDWAFIVFGSSSDPTSIVQRAVIRYGGYSGVYGGAIRLFNSSPTLDHITFFKNYRNAVEIRGNSTWSLTNTTVIHWLPDVINIAADQTLTIAPDVKIKGGGGISVTSRNSKLIANGTEAAPIIFTSERDDTVCGVGAANEPVCDTNNDGSASVPAVGQQGGIYFGPDSNASSSVQRVAMRYGGISLSNITPILDHITFYKCSINAVVIAAGNWTTHTWDNTSLVYWVNGSITLNPESTLTIAPGVKVKLNNGASINVTGANSKLVVNGTEANPVTFTSSRDDTICAIGAANEPICDSNNDGAASVPVTNDWGFIVFGSSSDPTSIVQRAVIRYGGYSGVYGGAIRLFNSSPTISYVKFSHNYRGLDTLQGARPVLVCNDFRNNSAGGIHNAQPSTIVTAENQWWNSSSGPTHTFNPGGTGERVSDGVDFTPWATVPCVPGEDPLAWTFMFYLDGDNNLDSNYQGVFNQLETMANNTAINLIVLWDRVGAGNSAYYRVKYDTNLWQQVSYTQGVDVWNQGELNMGDGATLRDFVLWTRARFPAQRYALFISDHGTGLNGTAKDVTSSSDWITMRELSDALSAATTNGSNKLDVLFADSCLMGMLETSYQIRNYVGFLVASENQSWIPPWGSSQPYPRYLTGVSASTTPEELARKIVTGYASWLDQTYPGQYGYTMSAVELSRIDQLVTATGDLATALRTGVATYGSSIAAARTAAQKFDSNDNGVISTDDEYIDLYDFAVQIRQRILTPDIQSLAQAVMTAVDVFVVDGAEVHRSGSLRYPGLDNGHGVSIFLPRGDFKRSFYSGSSLDFAADATWGVLDGLTFGETTGPGWGSMLVNYVEQQTPGAPDNPAPPALAQPVGTPGGGMVHMPLIIRNR
ncbi:MAG: clostripain-related cysteine peptidase [Anaerolineae bacterium]